MEHLHDITFPSRNHNLMLLFEIYYNSAIISLKNYLIWFGLMLTIIHGQLLFIKVD